jgi:hypothetical protein
MTQYMATRTAILDVEIGLNQCLEEIAKKEAQAKAPFEAAPGDPAVQIAAAVLVLLLCLARYEESALLNGDVELCRREPGHGHLQLISVFAGFLDVARG